MKLCFIVPLIALVGLEACPAGERPHIRARSAPAPLDCIPHPKFENGFALRAGDVIALAGGTRTAKLDERAYLETLMTFGAGEKNVYFRNMGWQADTVYSRQRPLDFGPEAEELKRAGATVLLASFGQMEALEGEARIPGFIAAYEKLLDGYAACTGRIVLVTPAPFGNPRHAAQPDLTRHNASVAAYASAILDLATKRGYACVDLSAFAVGEETTDGIQFTPAGEWRYSSEIVSQLLDRTALSAGELNGEGFADPKLEAWRRQIVEKNRLWREHWRPTNWAFAYGDRQDQPSSKDHRPGKPRWFPAELDGIIPLIEAAEDRILESRKELGR